AADAGNLAPVRACLDEVLQAVRNAGPTAEPAAALRLATAGQYLVNAMAAVHTAAGANIQVQSGYVNLFESVQPALQSALTMTSRMEVFKTTMPVAVVGMTVGAPLAQLAALLARPGNTWGKWTSPVTDIGCYALSAPAFGNADFAGAFAAGVPQGYTLNATGVDFFPTLPSPSPLPEVVMAGVQRAVTASIPACDDPWAERTAEFYCQALGYSAKALRPAGRPKGCCCRRAADAEAMALTTGSLPAGYSAAMAADLAGLSAAVYRRYQHPGNQATLPPQWAWAADVSANDVPWGSVFANATSRTVALVFRGTTSEYELVCHIDDVNIAYPSWLPATAYLGIGQGINALYDSLRGNLVAAIATGVSAAGGGAPTLLVAGHDCGGNLANLAALDLTLAAATPAVAGTYAFGAPPFASYAFSQFFADKIATSYWICRHADVVPQFALNYATYPVGALVTLIGDDDDDFNGNSYHGISTYLAILAPSAQPAARPKATPLQHVAALPQNERDVFERALAARDLHAGQVIRGELDTAETADGVMVLGWSPTGRQPSHRPLSGLDGRRLDAYFAVEAIRVRPGHELRLESSVGHAMHLVAGTITLEPGARLSAAARSIINVGALRGTPEGARYCTVAAIGCDGTTGYQGATGSTGASATDSFAASAGGNGGNGAPGGRGGDANDLTCVVGTIYGQIQVLAHGGQGGTGGKGGMGG
ncbi:MAG TPA: hypothetical protein VK196_14495, partial [Magnetospirillum sp.]|nr:hypothetical protein [Magnetospirillum sp.]